MNKSPFTEEEIETRIRNALDEGLTPLTSRGGYSKVNAFYLSFVGQVDEKDTWLGGCYIKADSFNEAAVISHLLKINPGGEVRLVGPFPAAALRQGYEHRLLNKREIDEAVDESLLTEEPMTTH